MKIRCPACETEHDLDVDLVPGQRIECFCGHRFVYEEAEDSDEPVAATRPDSQPAPPDAAEARALPPGTLLGRCRVEQKVGEGAMGAVYYAHHTTLDIPVAVKVMLPRYAQQPEFKDRFYREARTAARLNHVNVVHVYDCGDEGGLLYLVMEYIDGGNVRERLASEKRLPPGDVLEVGRAVCRALVAAARHQIVHRDIKPDNIMCTSDGVYKLADLGLAKQLSGPEDAALTMAAVSMGTPFYMAPEQALDARSCDARADLYALGATMYHLLCGRPPFTGSKPLEILQQHASGTCPPPTALVPGVAAGFDAVIGRAMMKSPDERYASAAEMLAALDELAGAPTSASAPALSGGGAVRFGGSRAWLRPVAIAAAALLLVSLVLTVGGRWRRQSRGNMAGPQQVSVARHVIGYEFGQILRGAATDKSEFAVHFEIDTAVLREVEPVTGAVLRLGSEKVALAPLGNGRFRLSAITREQPVSPLIVELQHAQGGSSPLELLLPAALPSAPEPVVPEKLPGDLAEEKVLLRWTGAPDADQLQYRVELGRVLRDGGWQTLLSEEAPAGASEMRIRREDAASAMYGMAMGTLFGVRYTAYRDVTLDGGVPVRVFATVETRLPASHLLLQESRLPGGKKLLSWMSSMEDESLGEQEKRALCERLIEEHRGDTIAALWQLMYVRKPELRQWVMITLGEICDRKDAVAGFTARFPGMLERRRMLRTVADTLHAENAQPPAGFEQLLRDLDPRNQLGTAQRQQSWGKWRPQQRPDGRQ